MTTIERAGWPRSMRQAGLVAVTAALLAAVAGGIGMAHASIPDARGVITACIKGKGEYFVDTERGQRCGEGRKTVRWNATGPRGPRGLQGATGPKGDVGPAGADGAPGAAADFDAIQVVSNSTEPTSIGLTWTVTARCPQGMRVIGGGGRADGSSSAHMTGSHPADAVVGGTPGWTVSWAADGNVGLNLSRVTAYATCVPD